MLSATTTREKPIAQYRIGEAEPKLKLQGLLMESMRAVEDELETGLEKPSQLQLILEDLHAHMLQMLQWKLLMLFV